MNKIQLSRITTLIGYFGLLIFIPLWHLLIVPLPAKFMSVTLLVQIGPLMFPLMGILHGKLYTHAWSMYLALFYFVIGVWYAGDASTRGFGIGFSRSSELGWQLVLDWVLINGGLSALGAMIAMAHPLTTLTAFLAAPLTSLNPTVGAGMVTAAVEIYLRRPEVGDFSRLRKDTSSLKGWWRNRVSRTLLVFLFSTLGSAAGTYVAGFRIFERLAS